MVLALLLASCGRSPTPTATGESATLPGAPTPTATPFGYGLPLVTPETQPPETPAAAAPLAATEAPAAPATIAYTVQEGDTLLGLALDYGVPMAAIQLQNGLGGDVTVRVGQTLEIPSAAGWQGASPFWIVHVVGEGETLSEIAQAYGLTLAELQSANGLTDADLIVVGQSLVLPLQTFAAALPTEAPTAAPTEIVATATETPPAAPTQVAAPPTVAPPPAAPPPADVADWPYETVRIINEVRAANGLPPLVYNELLAAAAQVQANDCAQRGWCGHTGSDGADIKTRILRVGYQPASWAECWAQRLDPQGAVDIWMDETPPDDPHRRTLLTTWLTEIGLGIAKTSWGYYFIADFGKPFP